MKLVVLVCALLSIASAQNLSGTVYTLSDGKVQFVPGVIDKISGTAFGRFDNGVNKTGWGVLSVSTNSSISLQTDDTTQAYAAGYLEGFLTQELMWYAHQNYIKANGQLPANVSTFMMEQLTWMKQQASKFRSIDYWRALNTFLYQVQGLSDGYNAAASSSQKLSFENVYALTMAGDLEDLLAAFSDKEVVNLRMDCSGLIKLSPDLNTLLTGHSTWNNYAYMLRIFKHYELNYQIAQTRISFSARPGDLNSKDDFYITNKGLSVMETSLTTFNKELYKSLSPKSVPCWARCQTANLLSTSALYWTSIFSMYNSGTHNNQWIIADYDLFTQNQGDALQPYTIMMLEQMGKFIESGDFSDSVTNDLFLGSFNIPYFPYIFKVSGYGEHGFNYDNDPRHKIFERDHKKATNITSMGHLMNSNDYQHDPLSQGNPCNAISARCDLLKEGAFPFGGIDAKAVDEVSIFNNIIYAISGPSHQSQPEFQFGQTWSSVPHIGMPNSWNFNWINTTLEV